MSATGNFHQLILSIKLEKLTYRVVVVAAVNVVVVVVVWSFQRENV